VFVHFLQSWRSLPGSKTKATTALDLYLQLFVCFSSGSSGSSCFFFVSVFHSSCGSFPFVSVFSFLPVFFVFFRSPPLFWFSPPYHLLPYALPLSIPLFVLFKRFPTFCFFLPMLPSSPFFIS